MKLFAVLVSGLLTVAFAQQKPPLSQIRAVYLFPMTNGMDQYLANRLTNLGLYVVVTDPKKADAVFSDRLGEAFESQLKELFPEAEPAPPVPPKQEPKPEAGAAKPSAPPEQAETTEPESKPKEERAVSFSTFRRAKGTLFLVDVRTRTVLWSIYEAPKDVSPQELDRTAERIAARLKREMLKTK